MNRRRLRETAAPKYPGFMTIPLAIERLGIGQSRGEPTLQLSRTIPPFPLARRAGRPARPSCRQTVCDWHVRFRRSALSEISITVQLIAGAVRIEIIGAYTSRLSPKRGIICSLPSSSGVGPEYDVEGTAIRQNENCLRRRRGTFPGR